MRSFYATRYEGMVIGMTRCENSQYQREWSLWHERGQLNRIENFNCNLHFWWEENFFLQENFTVKVGNTYLKVGPVIVKIGPLNIISPALENPYKRLWVAIYFYFHRIVNSTFQYSSFTLVLLDLPKIPFFPYFLLTSNTNFQRTFTLTLYRLRHHAVDHERCSIKVASFCDMATYSSPSP